ncbi:phosphatidylserine decarboxylase [Stakelama tenebrarum]|uniref:Phosphatidylserine decarboxylase proenzyme n=1 Tax=Stakelama tenebrarum TaxID=2711215 RepID=A0A6G6Y5P5_9SPHN|nr:phosphatidylserine decarboxylase [Sphingosinithalassobacter tenebrarum]QIG80274.1 phosphatidylserine decarboxylase [Sphingosinithalassobacter tenebrarum]
MAGSDHSDISAAPIKWRFPEVHPEGRKYVLIAGVLTFVSLWIWDFWVWPMLFLTIGVAAFFRDPVRVVPQAGGVLVSPADGLVTLVERVPPPPDLAGDAALGEAPLVRVSITMTIFDVHLNRAPIGGTVRHVIYVSGKFLNTERDKASEENERQHLIIEHRDGTRIGMTQIAGLVSRRVVSFVKSGDIVVSGQRVGLIRFGSRVDIYLPDDHVCQLAPGQRCVAGETIIARRGGSPVTGVAQ